MSMIENNGNTRQTDGLLNLLEHVRHLSKNDKKSLTEKTLKATEELGELSKKVLPYDNAFATTHRFVTSEEILGESAGLIIAALSIPYSLGFSTEEIVTMIAKKSDKWGDLQNAANRGGALIPFEIHVTVRVTAAQIDDFKKACRTLGVKPIVIELQKKKDENSVLDLMTSSVIKTDNRGAYEELTRIRKSLSCAGFMVVRGKIEVPPYHPGVPGEDCQHNDRPKNQYFESHINVLLPPESGEAEDRKLREIAEVFTCHLSRNRFKIKADGSYNQMLTYRQYDMLREPFEQQVAEITKELVAEGFIIEKVVTEFSIYDTNVFHDIAWVSSKTW